MVVGCKLMPELLLQVHHADGWMDGMLHELQPLMHVPRTDGRTLSAGLLPGGTSMLVQTLMSR